VQDTSFEESLKLLKWPTLEQRRSFLSLIECYKTINRPNGLDALRLCFRFAHDLGPLGADHRFKLKFGSTPLNNLDFKHSFFIRITNKWNSLGKEIVEAENLNRLRCHLAILF